MFISGSKRQLLLAALLGAALIAAPVAATAGQTGEISKQAGLGVTSALASLVYAPVKLAYAVGGLVVGGLAWTFSGGDNEVAKVVLVPSVLGDYVITPSQLKREQPIEFFGRDPAYLPDQQEIDVAARPPAEEQANYDTAW